MGMIVLDTLEQASQVHAAADAMCWTVSAFLQGAVPC